MPQPQLRILIIPHPIHIPLLSQHQSIKHPTGYLLNPTTKRYQYRGANLIPHFDSQLAILVWTTHVEITIEVDKGSVHGAAGDWADGWGDEHAGRGGFGTELADTERAVLP